jgi:hypothetical protein
MILIFMDQHMASTDKQMLGTERSRAEQVSEDIVVFQRMIWREIFQAHRQVIS